MKKKKKYYRYKDSHRTVRGIKQKRCTMCDKWKPESEFHKDRARTDGLKIRCKDCNSIYELKLKRKSGKYLGKNLKFEQRHRTANGIREKFCSGCKKWKKENEFYRNRPAKGGLDNHCKECKGKSTKSPRKP